MFGILQEEKWISLIMFLLLGISIFMRLLLGFLYGSIIREADNMAVTENKLLRQCKLKFANCYQLSGGVSNIPVFVDKFIQRLALGPFSFEGIYHFSGQTMLLSVVVSGVGICKNIAAGRTLGDILPFYIVSFIGLYLYFSVSSAVDIKSRKRILKVNLVDYLENHLSARMDVTAENMVMLYGEDAVLYGEKPSVYQQKKKNNRGKRRKNQAAGNGRRTLELMPIGGRISVTQTQNPVVEETETPVMEAQDRIPAAETTGVPGYASEPVSTQAPVSNPDDTKISKEELEALLEEFLVI